MEEFIIKLPAHLTLSIEHNNHKKYYQDLKEYINNLKNAERPPLNELSEEEYKKCIELDEFWQITWYPRTPIGFHVVYGSTLTECILQITSKEYN